MRRELGAGVLSVWLEEANLKLVAVHMAPCSYELVPESHVDRTWWPFRCPCPRKGRGLGVKGS